MAAGPALTQARQSMTVDEYLAGATDEFKSELVYGELVVGPSATRKHQDIQLHLTWLLKRWANARSMGEVSHDLDMVLDKQKHLIYRPDLLFVARAHENRWQRGRVFGPADLAVEILSPSDRPRMRRRKFADYERYAVAWFWILDPEALTIEENELVEGSYQCRSEVSGNEWFEPGLFPGLRLRLPPLIKGDLKDAVKGEARKLI